jgi:hypothetical protein
MEILLAAPPPTINLEAGVVWVKGFLLLVCAVVLVYMTLRGLLTHGQRGDYSQAISMVGASLIVLSLLGFASGVAVITGYGNAMLSAVTKILS